jgi:catechol 2,3-dioxygenase-like lactoylglutathione lyase family enzyme
VASRAVPVLTSRDIATTLAFYQGLGFENRGAPPDEWDYLILVRDGVELHFSGPAAGTRAPGFCFVYVDDADSIYTEWHGKAASPGRIERPLNTNYGMRVFALFDPDDNEIRVGSAPRHEPG